MTQLFLQSSHIIFSLASESRQQFDTKTKMLFGRRKMPQTAKGNRFSEKRCQDSYNATNTRLTVTREIIAKLWCKQRANILKCSDPNSKMTPGIRNCTGKTVLLKQNVSIPGSIAPKDPAVFHGMSDQQEFSHVPYSIPSASFANLCFLFWKFKQQNLLNRANQPP